MRALPLILLAMFAAPAAAGAQVVPYDNFPVCLQVYVPGYYTECRYNSIAQCQATASGRSAQCLVNPYFVSATPQSPGPRHRRHRAD
jgi:hypothetical protein